MVAVRALKCKNKQPNKNLLVLSFLVMSDSLIIKMIYYLVISYLPFISFLHYIKALYEYFAIMCIRLYYYQLINLGIKGGIKILAIRGMLRLKGLKTNAPWSLTPLHSDSPFIKCPLKTSLASKEMLPVTTHLSFLGQSFFYRWKCHITKIFPVFFFAAIDWHKLSFS